MDNEWWYGECLYIICAFYSSNSSSNAALMNKYCNIFLISMLAEYHARCGRPCDVRMNYMNMHELLRNAGKCPVHITKNMVASWSNNTKCHLIETFNLIDICSFLTLNTTNSIGISQKSSHQSIYLQWAIHNIEMSLWRSLANAQMRKNKIQAKICCHVFFCILFASMRVC